MTARSTLSTPSAGSLPDEPDEAAPDRDVPQRSPEAGSSGPPSPEQIGIGSLFWHVRDAVVVTDAASGTVVLWNPAAEAILGYSAAEATGMPVDVLIPDELRGEIRSELDRYATTGRSRFTDSPAPAEYPVRRKDGSIIVVEATVTPIDPATHPGVPGRYLLSISRDVTERKRAEQALRDSGLAQELLLNSARAILWRCDAQAFHFSYVSKQAEALLGYPVARWTAEPGFWAEHIHPDDREWAVNYCVTATNALRAHEFEYRMIAADGRVVWLRDLVAVLSEEGRPTELVGVMVDITEERRVREELERTSRQRELILATAAEGIYGLDAEGRTTFANPAAARLTGYDVDELLGASQHELLHHTRADGTPYPRDECPIHAALRDGAVRHAEDEVFWRKDGTSFPVEYTSTPTVVDGKVAGAVVTFRDVTERKRAAAELAQRAEDLARSNLELEQFAYVASHDLQEPLRTVVSYLQLLEEDYRQTLGETGKEFLDFAVDGAKRMQTLIDDLLAYSRAGRRGRRLARVSADTVLRDVLADLEAHLHDAGATVTHDRLPVVLADAVQLGQLFQNLLSNGLKFRGPEPPRIHVWAERQEGDDGKGGTGPVWRFAVRDNGIGIDSQYHEQIFVIFQRLHVRDEYPGTGIGLAVCRKIVERHGGKLWVESSLGQGATFYFTLPAVEQGEGA